MEKFSLYDFLGLLLPGVIFLFFLNLINTIYGISPVLTEAINGDTNIVVSLCFALIIGAILYALNFYLVTKKWYNRLFGMYKHVADLYSKMEFLHPIINKTLNRKAKECYKKKIFFEKSKYENLSEVEEKDIKDLQDKYYDQMYYELEYHEKNEQSKAFQSFYYFFRQTALACFLLLVLELVIFLLSLLPFINFSQQIPAINTLIMFAFSLLTLLIVSVQLARWYRKRMVMKIYWTYYTHLQQPDNNK